MTLLTPLLVLIIFGFAVAAWAILFHFNRYAVPGDRTPLIRRVFLIGNAFFLVFTAISFFSLL